MNKRVLLVITAVLVLALAIAGYAFGAKKDLAGELQKTTWLNSGMEMVFINNTTVALTDRGLLPLADTEGKTFLARYTILDGSRVLIESEGPFNKLFYGEHLTYNFDRRTLALRSVDFLFSTKLASDAFLTKDRVDRAAFYENERQVAIRTATISNLRSMIGPAQKSFKESLSSDVDHDGIGEYGTIEQLRAPNHAASPGGHGLLNGRLASGNEANHYIVSIYVPDSVDGREEVYLVCAMPMAGSSSKVMFAMRENGIVYESPYVGTVPAITQMLESQQWASQSPWSVAGIQHDVDEIYPGIANPY